MTNSLHPPAALRLRVLHSQGKAPTVCSVFPMKLPGSSFFPMDLRYAAASISATAPPLCSHSSTAPPLSSRSATAQPLCSRSATEPLPATPPQRPCQQQLCHGVPASNKPHPAEKSTPIWLAIWRTWAGFANSQLLNAAFSSTNNICWIFPCSTLGCRSDRRKSVGPSAPIAYATSVSPPDEAIAWLGRWYPMGHEAAAWLWRWYQLLDVTAA